MELFSKNCLSAILVVLSLTTINASLTACECCDAYEDNRMYVGAFGGGIYSNDTHVSQQGTIFFLEAQGGPLAVNARGHAKENSSGLGGAQFGYEWTKCPMDLEGSGWTITPAVELEAFWYSQTKKGHLLNPTDRLLEHDFLDTFPMDMGVYLANAVFSLNNPYFGPFSPYISGGVGATRLSIRNATSLQTAPPEAGINHFDSDRSDTTWTFAGQVKAGLRYNFCQSFHLFAEYRYLFVDCSRFVLGSTVAPGHATTSPWDVKVHNIHNNAFVVAFSTTYNRVKYNEYLEGLQLQQA